MRAALLQRGIPAVNPALRVTLGTNLVKCRDISPILRNDNSTSSYKEVKIGPSGLLNIDGVWTLFAESIQATGFLANNGETAPIKVTCDKLTGTYTISPLSLVSTAGDTSTWEYNERSFATVWWDERRTRLVAWFHGGNNGGPGGRQGGLAYSLDGKAGLSWAVDARNPLIPVGITGAFDDKQAGGDLKLVQNPWGLPQARVWGLYRGQKTGSSQTAGTTGRVEGPDIYNLTKTGEVIASTSLNTTGVTSGQPIYDAGGRAHCWFPLDANGIAYGTSDDHGKTWSSPLILVLSPSGTAGAYDQFGSGDVLQAAVDGDVVVLIYGAENITTFPTNNPMRGQCVALQPWAQVAPLRPGKFALASAYTAISSTSLMNTTTFTVMGRFRACRTDRSKARYLYTSEPSGGVFNKNAYIRIADVSSGNAGKLDFFFRTPTAIAQVTSTATYDDGAWHTFIAHRNSAASFDLYVDGASVGTPSTNNPATDATAVLQSMGNWNSATAEPDGPFNGTISDFGIVTGAAWTAAECAAWIDHRALGAGGTVVFDSKLNGTDNGNVVQVEAA